MWILVRRAALLMAITGSVLLMRAGTLGSLNLDNFGLVLGFVFLISGDAPNTPCFVAASSCIVLFEQNLTPTDIGSVLRFGSSSPGFHSVVSLLTDGTDDEWSATRQGAGGAIGQSVSSMLPARNGPDFAGDTITEIDLTVNDLVFKQVQLPVSITNPGILGTFTEADANFTITVQGSELPEPQTVLLVPLALLVGGASRRLWKRPTSRRHFHA